MFYVLHNFDYKVPYEILPCIKGAWERSSPPKCLIGLDDATKRNAQVENIRSRRKLMVSGEILVPEMPSSEFTKLKSAILHSIQLYNIDKIDLEHRMSAISYNLVSLAHTLFIICTSFMVLIYSPGLP